jgi:hypothetical protein
MELDQMDVSVTSVTHATFLLGRPSSTVYVPDERLFKSQRSMPWSVAAHRRPL